MIVGETISRDDLVTPCTKAIVHVDRPTASICCELHSDCAEELEQDASRGRGLWGCNIDPDGRLAFISLITPAIAGHRSREIKDEALCERIAEIVKPYLL